jgi:hypothetical protein
MLNIKETIEIQPEDFHLKLFVLFPDKNKQDVPYILK